MLFQKVCGQCISFPCDYDKTGEEIQNPWSRCVLQRGSRCMMRHKLDKDHDESGDLMFFKCSTDPDTQ